MSATLRSRGTSKGFSALLGWFLRGCIDQSPWRSYHIKTRRRLQGGREANLNRPRKCGDRMPRRYTLAAAGITSHLKLFD
jgi:hypothetical protein